MLLKYSYLILILLVLLPPLAQALKPAEVLVVANRFVSSTTADAVIDRGTEGGVSVSGISLVPQKKYRHPRSIVDRRVVDAPDVGPHEFQK